MADRAAGTAIRHLADRLIAQGALGLLFPSPARPGGIDIVLWKTAAPAAVRVFDPNRDLPRDISFW